MCQTAPSKFLATGGLSSVNESNALTPHYGRRQQDEKRPLEVPAVVLACYVRDSMFLEQFGYVETEFYAFIFQVEARPIIDDICFKKDKTRASESNSVPTRECQIRNSRAARISDQNA